MSGSTIAIIIIIVALLVILFTSYVKSPPDKAYIISGLRKTPKILIGKAGLKLPFFERKDELLIKQISIDIKTGDYVPTLDFIGVNIDAVAKVKIRTDEEGIQLAMKNFLNMKEPQIMEALVDSLQGNMREIIGTISLKDLCNDRKSFGDQVQEKAQVDMNRLGIEIISCNIQHVEDQNDLIIALGQDNMAAIQKNASIAKANADRDVAIAQAQARKEANDAKVLSDTEIAVKQNELSIKKAELKTIEDTKNAEADAAYEIQKEAQRKTIEVTKTEADIARQEKEVDLKKKEAEVMEQSLDADIRKKAEADKFARQQQADAELYKRQRNAEADKFEKQQEAEAKKAQAEAELFAKQQEAAGGSRYPCSRRGRGEGNRSQRSCRGRSLREESRSDEEVWSGSDGGNDREGIAGDGKGNRRATLYNRQGYDHRRQRRRLRCRFDGFVCATGTCEDDGVCEGSDRYRYRGYYACKYIRCKG